MKCGGYYWVWVFDWNFIMIVVLCNVERLVVQGWKLGEVWLYNWDICMLIYIVVVWEDENGYIFVESSCVYGNVFFFFLVDG